MIMKVEIAGNKIKAPLKGNDVWLVNKPEEQVRQEYICRLVNNYGFDLEQMDQEIQVNNSQRGQGRAMADIVIWRNMQDKRENNSPLIVVNARLNISPFVRKIIFRVTIMPHGPERTSL